MRILFFLLFLCITLPAIAGMCWKCGAEKQCIDNNEYCSNCEIDQLIEAIRLKEFKEKVSKNDEPVKLEKEVEKCSQCLVEVFLENGRRYCPICNKRELLDPGFNMSLEAAMVVALLSSREKDSYRNLVSYGRSPEELIDAIKEAHPENFELDEAPAKPKKPKVAHRSKTERKLIRFFRPLIDKGADRVTQEKNYEMFARYIKRMFGRARKPGFEDRLENYGMERVFSYSNLPDKPEEVLTDFAKENRYVEFMVFDIHSRVLAGGLIAYVSGMRNKEETEAEAVPESEEKTRMYLYLAGNPDLLVVTQAVLWEVLSTFVNDVCDLCRTHYDIGEVVFYRKNPSRNAYLHHRDIYGTSL